MRAAAIIVMALLGLAPAHAAETVFAAPRQATAKLTIASTTDLAIFAPIVRAFQLQWPGVAITYDEVTTNELNARVAGACDSGRFVADLVISSSIDQQLKLINDGCGLTANPGVLDPLPDWAQWRDELFGVTFEPAVIVYNRAYFADKKVPASRFDLIDLLRDSDAFRARVGTYDIETSGVGYLLAFLDAAQATTWGRLVESLGRNQAQLFCCTADILDRVADGRLLVGYNVLGSYALARMESDPRIGIVLPSDYTLVLARAAFVSRDAQNPQIARDFLDFLFSATGRAILAGPARLFSPVDGADQLFRLAPFADGDPQSLRPVPFSPALLVGLDRAKRDIFLSQWRAALPSDASALLPTEIGNQ